MRTFFMKYRLICNLLSVVFCCLFGTGNAQNFPPLNIIIEDSSATQGYYFLTPYNNTPPYIYDHAQMILDNLGRIIYYRVFPKVANPNATIDFKLQPNGRMSYCNIKVGKHYIMDSTFTVVDSIECANGINTDQHDLQILPDNHYFLLGSEIRIMNLSSYHWFGINHNIPGGTNAQVEGVVIQEFNENKELIWEWKGHDHYQFGDVDPVWLFSPSKVDWTHANAVERDIDGNILLSLRHFNEITKIDYATGNILWRLGGKQNQFTFPNDTLRFTGQHDIRRVSDTSISLYDNGQYTTPPVSRAIEYALDETNKIATLVWEYIYDSSHYSVACGNHQYSENGNHVIDFGFWNNNGLPWMVVVRPDKTKVLEIRYPSGYISYRAFNYLTLPWELNRPGVECIKSGNDYYLVAEPGHEEYRWSTGDSSSTIRISQTGEYWVFVPYGAGYLSSERILITDTTTPCLFTGEYAPVIPEACSLTILPNPATDHAGILFHLPSASDVRIILHNSLGTGIQKPVDGYYPAGDHKTVMDVATLARGIYLLSLEVSNTRIVRKLMIY